MLRALRDRIALEIDNAGCARDVEPLARRLQSLAAEIEDLAVVREPNLDDPIEVIKRRRERRRRDGVAVVRAHG